MQVNRPPSDKYGGNSGDPVHFSSTQSSEMQIADHALGPARASQRLSICRLNRAVLNRTDVFIRERQRRLLRPSVGNPGLASFQGANLAHSVPRTNAKPGVRRSKCTAANPYSCVGKS